MTLAAHLCSGYLASLLIVLEFNLNVVDSIERIDFVCPLWLMWRFP